MFFRTFKTLVEKLKKEGRAKDFFDSQKANIEKLMESAVVKDNEEVKYLQLNSKIVLHYLDFFKLR